MDANTIINLLDTNNLEALRHKALEEIYAAAQKGTLNIKTNTIVRFHVPGMGYSDYMIPMDAVYLRAMKSSNATVAYIYTDYSTIKSEYMATKSIDWLNSLVQQIEDLPENLASKALDLLAIGTDWEHICEELEI